MTKLFFISFFSFNALLANLIPLFPETDFALAKEDLMLYADKGQFDQVMINVLKNAVEAMAEEKEQRIEVNCYQDEKWQYIHISDHGSGIANTNNLFVPFYTTKQQGSGIGLTLCRQIMFNHNGQFKLNNRKDKAGVEAILSLPRFTNG